MPLPVLAGLVVFGVSLVVLLVHLTGGSKKALIDSPQHARTIAAANHDDCELGHAVVSSDGSAALIDAGNRGMVAIKTFGARHVSRLFAKGSARLLEPDPGTIRLRFSDFTFPELKLEGLDEIQIARIRPWCMESTDA